MWIGDNISNAENIQQNTSLQIWETSQTVKEDSSLQSYYNKATGILLLFSLGDLSSFQHLENWMNEIKLHSQRRIPVMLIGNKSDLQDRKVSWRDIEAFTRKHDLSYFQANCYSELNYEMILSAIADGMKKTDNNLDLGKNEEKDDKACKRE